MDAEKAINGCKYQIILNSIDISGEANDASFQSEKESNQVRSFGNCYDQNTPDGVKAGSGSATVFFTTDATTAEEAVFNAHDGAVHVPLLLSPAGGDVGDVQYSFPLGS